MKHKDQRVGVFIDTQNMYYSARNLYKRKVNFKNIVEDAVGDRKLIRAISYVVSTDSGENEPFFEALEKAGIETRRKALMEYPSGHKKADWDVGLAIDVVQMLDTLDVVVIVSGDGDFQPLVNYVKSRGRIVELMAFDKTTSGKLIEMVHSYTDLAANQRRYLIGPRLGGQRSPGEAWPGSAGEVGGRKEEEEEEKEEEEGINDDGSFFMKLDDSVTDQEESRTRRLEF